MAQPATPRVRDPQLVFKHKVDSHYFELNNVTIVKLESKEPLQIDYIQEIQQGCALTTTRIGKLTWTKFENWKKALQFYEKYHKHQRWNHAMMIASPVIHEDWTSQEGFIKSMEGNAARFGFTLITKPVDGPVICH